MLKKVKIYHPFLAVLLDLALSLLGAVIPVTPAHADVTHNDQHWDNYVGLQWQFGQITKQSGNCGSRPCSMLYPQYRIFVTVRINRKIVCNESIDISDHALGYEGKKFKICGQDAVWRNSSNPTATGDGFITYTTPSGYTTETDSPGHCSYQQGVGTNYICDHFWVVQWGPSTFPKPIQFPRPLPPQSGLPSPPNNNKEIVYLSSCGGPNGKTAEMNYYRDASKSGNRQRPDATAQVHLNSGLWAGQHVGTFSDGNFFRVNIGTFNQVGTVNGSGANKHHPFTCRVDSGRVLYTDDRKVCSSTSYCQP